MSEPRRVSNPPNPFERDSVEWDWDAGDDARPEVRLELYEEHAKSIVSENRSPDVGFRFSVNPYRGCFHGCIYCYARPSHQYLGFGAGSDFDRKIVVKVNAPELLEARLASPRWQPAPIAFSGNTDCYQPIEASYELTRRCLEVCLRHDNPVTLITKGHVIRRDIALLAELERRAGCTVTVSLAFSDDEMRKRFDPYAAPVAARLETIRRLAEAGIPTGVGVSPIVPGVNDAMIPEILERAHAAGAAHAFLTMVRLPREVRPFFDERVRELLPLRHKKVMSAIEELRGGGDHSGFGARMRGSGPRWEMIERLFETHVKRLGMNATRPEDDLGPAPATRPPATRQLTLF